MGRPQKIAPILSDLSAVNVADAESGSSHAVERPGIRKMTYRYIDRHLRKSGIGVYQVVYVVAMSLCWTYSCSLHYTEEFFRKTPSKIWPYHLGKNHSGMEMWKDLDVQVPENLDEEDKDDYFTTELENHMFYGCMVGCMIFAILGDRLGVRKLLFPGLAVSIFFHLLMSIVSSKGDSAFKFLKICKTIAFMGNNIFTASTYMWMAQLLSSKHQAFLAIVPNSFWSFGQIFPGVIHQRSSSWREYYRIVFGIGTLFFCYYFGTERSPTALFTESTNDTEEERDRKVLKALRRIRAINNGDADAPEMHSLAESDSDSESESESVQDNIDNLIQESEDNLLSWNNFIKFFVLAALWLFCASALWGISLNDTGDINAYSENFYGAISASPGDFAAGFLIAFMPDHRYALFVMAFAGGFFLLLSSFFHAGKMADLPENTQARHRTFSLIFNYLANVFVQSLSSGTYSLSPLLFKGKNCNMIMGILMAIENLGGVFSAWVEGLTKKSQKNYIFKRILPKWLLNLDDSDDWMTVMLPAAYALPLLVSPFLVFLLPEMRSKKGGRSFAQEVQDVCGCKLSRGRWSYFFTGKRIPFMIAALVALGVYCWSILTAAKFVLVSDKQEMLKAWEAINTVDKEHSVWILPFGVMFIALFARTVYRMRPRDQRMYTQGVEMANLVEAQF